MERNDEADVLPRGDRTERAADARDARPAVFAAMHRHHDRRRPRPVHRADISRRVEKRVDAAVAAVDDRSADALGGERPARGGRGREMQGRDPGNLDAVALLRPGIGQVVRPQPGLDMADRDAEPVRGARARQRAVGVALDQDEPRPGAGQLIGRERFNRRAHRVGVYAARVEPERDDRPHRHSRALQIKLRMLAGAQERAADPAPVQRAQHGRHFDRLRTRSDDGRYRPAAHMPAPRKTAAA